MERLEILEGAWEELAVHAGKLKGRRLRVFLLPLEAAAAEVGADQATLCETAIQLFSEADAIEREPNTPSGNPRKKAFGEIITEKYRKMGLEV